MEELLTTITETPRGRVPQYLDAHAMRVRARLVRKHYNKGEKISHTEMGKLMLTGHKTLPTWNYTLAPSKM